MFTTTLAAIAFATAMQSPMPVSDDTYQATKAVCRPFATSPHHTGPVCRGSGGGPLAAQEVCFCHGPDVKFEEPACWADGSPALFRRGVRPTGLQTDKLISCIDWQRQQDKRNR